MCDASLSCSQYVLMPVCLDASLSCCQYVLMQVCLAASMSCCQYVLLPVCIAASMSWCQSVWCQNQWRQSEWCTLQYTTEWNTWGTRATITSLCYRKEVSVTLETLWGCLYSQMTEVVHWRRLGNTYPLWRNGLVNTFPHLQEIKQVQGSSGDS